MVASERIVLLGVPVDNVCPSEAVQVILQFIDQFRLDGRARYVATLNVDFLVNSLGWTSSQHRHPELTSILRNADLITADGMPLIWLSWLLGALLKARTTGADLSLLLAEALAQRGGSVFLLGGAEDTARISGMRLARMFPGLRLAGTAAPHIHVTGDALANERKQDKALVAKINEAQADVLYLGLGNPKQELWFHRVRPYLRVPVTIGLGGTFDFLAGRKARAPRMMQQAGLEWLFRVSQEPRRLAKRYLLGLCKLTWMCLPLLSRHYWQTFRTCFGLVKNKPSSSPPWVLSSKPTREEIEQLIRWPHAADCRYVYDLSPQTMAALLACMQEGVAFTHISKAMQKQLRAARILDLIGHRQAKTDKTLSDIIKEQKSPILDLSDSPFIDNAALCLLMEQAEKHGSLQLKNAGPQVQQALHLAKIKHRCLSEGRSVIIVL